MLYEALRPDVNRDAPYPKASGRIARVENLWSVPADSKAMEIPYSQSYSPSPNTLRSCRRDEGEENNPSEAPSLLRGAKEGIRLRKNSAHDTLRSLRRELYLSFLSSFGSGWG